MPKGVRGERKKRIHPAKWRSRYGHAEHLYANHPHHRKHAFEHEHSRKLKEYPRARVKGKMSEAKIANMIAKKNANRARRGLKPLQRRVPRVKGGPRAPRKNKGVKLSKEQKEKRAATRAKNKGSRVIHHRTVPLEEKRRRAIERELLRGIV